MQLQQQLVDTADRPDLMSPAKRAATISMIASLEKLATMPTSAPQTNKALQDRKPPTSVTRFRLGKESGDEYAGRLTRELQAKDVHISHYPAALLNGCNSEDVAARWVQDKIKQRDPKLTPKEFAEKLFREFITRFTTETDLARATKDLARWNRKDYTDMATAIAEFETLVRLLGIDLTNSQVKRDFMQRLDTQMQLSLAHTGITGEDSWEKICTHIVRADGGEWRQANNFEFQSTLSSTH